MERRIPRSRPKALTGKTYQISTGCGTLYITINSDEVGIFELFATIGKTGGCAASQCEAIGRIVSLALRTGAPVKSIIKQLSGIACQYPTGIEDKKVFSCSDAIGKIIKLHVEEAEQNKTDIIK